MPRRLRRTQTASVALLVLSCLFVTGCGPSLGEDNGPPPDPMSAEVAGARMQVTNRADDALARAVAALGGNVVGRASSDDCYEGQNNYKLREGFDHRCTLRRAAVVVFDGDFRRRIALLDERLFAAGWGCYRDPCPETLSGKVEEYWEFRKQEYGGHDPPITSLPTTTMYERGDQYLDVQYVGRDRSSRSSLEGWHRRKRGGLFTSYERARPLGVEAVFARASGFDYAVALAIETDYFEDLDIG